MKGLATAVRRVWAAIDVRAFGLIAAGVIVATQDLPDASGAGRLLIAGGILAQASGHVLGLIAGLPGLTAAFEVFGAGSEPTHAVAGGAALAVLVGAAWVPTTLPPVGSSAIDRVRIAAATAFAVLPVWSWSDVTPTGHEAATATAIAFVVPALVVAAWLHRPEPDPVEVRDPSFDLWIEAMNAEDEDELPAARPRRAGRLTARPDPDPDPEPGGDRTATAPHVPPLEEDEASRGQGRPQGRIARILEEFEAELRAQDEESEEGGEEASPESAVEVP